MCTGTWPLSRNISPGLQDRGFTRNSITVVNIDRWWLRVYLEVAPVGTLLTAAIAAYIAGAWPPWDNRQDLEFFAVLVTLGLACYGSVIWIFELGGLAMLWAFNKYQGWRAIDKKNTQKDLIRTLTESGFLDISEITSERLRELGLEGLDLKDLRDKEPTRR